LKFQDFRKITSCFCGVYRIYLNSIKKNRKIATLNQLDLESLGFD
jgi:hypothetical protein